MTLEESFTQLDELVDKLEKGNLSLNDSFKLYKDGIKLIENCSKQLDKVEKEMIVLNGQEGTDDEL